MAFRLSCARFRGPRIIHCGVVVDDDDDDSDVVTFDYNYFDKYLTCILSHCLCFVRKSVVVALHSGHHQCPSGERWCLQNCVAVPYD